MILLTFLQIFRIHNICGIDKDKLKPGNHSFKSLNGLRQFSRRSHHQQEGGGEMTFKSFLPAQLFPALKAILPAEQHPQPLPNLEEIAATEVFDLEALSALPSRTTRVKKWDSEAGKLHRGTFGPGNEHFPIVRSMENRKCCVFCGRERRRVFCSCCHECLCCDEEEIQEEEAKANNGEGAEVPNTCWYRFHMRENITKHP
jgi:hypothetical protein